MAGVADLPEGALFGGDYRLLRPLAAGGMGAVYVVQQLSTGKSRALKVMRSDLAEDAEARRRFILEAQVGARIQSEHVVDVLSAGVDEATGAPFLVMELLEGEDLATRIERAGPLSLDEAREIFEQLCHAVGQAHVAGIVHRDLKPENIFLARSRRAGERGRTSVKVLDFGIARLVAESTTHAKTQGMIGTPLWMSPEQTEKGKLTPAADVWALGLILYYCLTGHTYWRSGQDPEATFSMVMKEVLFGELPLPTLRARDDRCPERVPAALDPVFARAVARRPEARFPDADAFWAALEPAFGASSSSSLSSSSSSSLSSSARRVVVGQREASSPHLELAATGHSPTPFDPPPAPAMPAPFPQAPGFPYPGPPGPAMPWGPTGGRARPQASRFPIWTIPVGLLVLALTMTTCLGIMRGSRREAQRPTSRQPIISGSVGESPSPAATVVARPPPCRLCTTDASVITGPHTREQVVTTIERSFPRLDDQCLTARGRNKPKGGTLTLTFVIREGRVSKRDIESSTFSNEVDKCLSDSLGEVVFARAPEESQVRYALKFDPAAR
jgi:serine/threonine-protein kinase